MSVAAGCDRQSATSFCRDDTGVISKGAAAGRAVLDAALHRTLKVSPNLACKAPTELTLEEGAHIALPHEAAA